MRSLLFVVLILVLLSSCQKSVKTSLYDHVPDIEELSGKWLSPDTADMEASIRNFQSQALCNQDLSSISWLASAPYAGGYHTGILKVNDGVPLVKEFKWEAFQALRKSEMDGIAMQSSVRMPIEKNAVMWEIKFSNRADSTKALKIEQDLIGFISKYPGDWQWWYPYPKLDGATTVRDDEVANVRKYIGKKIPEGEMLITELVDGKPQQRMMKANWPNDLSIMQSDKYTSSIEAESLYFFDTETDAISGFKILDPGSNLTAYNSGGRVKIEKNLAPGQDFIFRYVMAYGDNKEQIKKELDHLASHFEKEFTSIKTEWKTRWTSLFDPESDLLSGTFPILETDDVKAKKVYYTGPLTLLYLMHTNLPQHDKVFLTGGPRWGASITFFWDITEWSTLWATIDPQMMKEHLSSWILIDPSINYGQDNQGGKGVGNGYSANYWALFQMIRAYVSISGDYEFLDQTINSKTVFEHLNDYATHWKKISIYGEEGATDELYKLADFGADEWNLLECVPTYKHIVPSFNAGYVWMMREMADMYEYKGQADKADILRKEANDMVDRILQLYAGDGVWYSLYPDGKKIEVRHCLDFMFLGRYLPNDIPNNIQEDMMEFVYRELITDHWMRAQSLRDVAAKDSDRADHGPLGAFDGWPAGTMDALTQLGFPQKALEFYHNIEGVTYEGIWAQAHELWGEDKFNKNAKVRIAQRGWHNRESSSGIAMSQVMLKDFFGFYPEINGKALIDIKEHEFEGTLYHVKYQGKYYTLITKGGQTEMIAEE